MSDDASFEPSTQSLKAMKVDGSREKQKIDNVSSSKSRGHGESKEDEVQTDMFDGSPAKRRRKIEEVIKATKNLVGAQDEPHQEQ